MQLYKTEEQLCFDDVLLVPQSSDIASRSNVDLSTVIGYGQKSLMLSLPIIASPMDTVCEIDMARAVAKAGGIGIIHRFMNKDEQKNQVFQLAKENLLVGAAVSIQDTLDRQEYIQSLVTSGARLILLDVANGHNTNAIDAIKRIKKKFDVHIMAGNVSTWDGFLALAIAGADSIRVGIGGGSMCTTRIVSGHGVPTLSSIMDVNSMLERMSLPCSVIADGGIRNTGDMVKAFAAGADAVMLGSVLAGHDESPGEIMFDNNDRPFKSIRGMASENAQIDFKGSISVVEGVSSEIAYKGAVENTLKEIRGGLSSGCSYSGVQYITDLKYNSQYIKISSNSVKENQPHGKNA